MATRKPLTLTAATRNCGLESLRALRDALAAEIKAGVPPERSSQTAPLARQLRETLREIAELEKAQPHGSIVDEIGKKRGGGD
jgi:hypothetical protein